MAKSKSCESEPKRSGSKRKKLNSNERDVCIDENRESKGKKKRKNTYIEEAPIPVPTVSKNTSEDVVTNSKKRKQPADDAQKEKKRKKKNKTTGSPGPIIVPAAAEDEGEDKVMEGEEDLSPEEKRVLERKMKKILKKEKKDQLKAEGKTEDKDEASKPIAPQQALDYLTCWAEKRKEWKFQKTRQTWLLQHMFDSEKIPDENFSVLLSYLEGLRGAARDTTVQKAETLVREGEQDTDAQQRIQRAREIIQLLS
ncbi:uncharacterized protein C7orf50 homolog [Salvelinus fontinalis]|uniref:uncharacterized protein C7orf50 homolog n=1 Tax=Salvelinus fontinalis TaxID=8038 RepID=UPI002486864A|nr:uncharacterized protein C7orf50 homolog [Salvelinus fontinalis]